MTDILSELQAEFIDLRAKNDQLREALNEIRFEDVGWTIIDGTYDDDEGMSLDKIKEVSETLRDMTEVNPLFKRGSQLRHGYIFGRGIAYDGVKPKAQTAMDHPYNRDALFSTEAQESLLKARFTDGNIFITRRKSDNLLTRVPISQITGTLSDPDSAERVWFIKREWKDDKGKAKSRWFPVSTYTGKKRDSIGESGHEVSVDNDHVMYFKPANRQTGWTLGVPDSLAAMKWAIGYSEYLTNNTDLVRAYAKIAYKVTSQSKTGQNNAAVAVRPAGVGGTAVQGPGTELSAMPNMGSGVNFNNGQPIAAMVAASFGVSVIALLSSPGAAGGSYGAAQTLDSPTVRVMESAQDWFKDLYEMILRDMGSKDATATFASIESDPNYRQIQSIAQVTAQGLLHREEARGAVLELIDIPKTLPGLPEPDEFNSGHIPGDEVAANPVPGQGNTGVVGNPASDVSNHDSDNE
jgi:hypothetical protein